MEFDALKAAGAAHVLHDRSVLASDVFNTMICRACGTMGEIHVPSLGGIVKGDGFTCRACGAQNNAVELQTTYCYGGLLKNELAAMGIGVKHELGAAQRELGTAQRELGDATADGKRVARRAAGATLASMLMDED